ncbi:flowering locus K homology domain-like [Triticum urartu]|uniref:K Homology domain-containing protein n=2 Tax=Triticum urartu TaxID=4572 RepID=A0A8R7QAP4_TRIUA|nr:flowering locus K homology domain-like [Triticum urartu]
MDGPAEAPAVTEHEMSEIPNPTSGEQADASIEEQANPESDVAEQIKEEAENTSDEEPKGTNNEESGNPSDEAQVTVKDDDMGDQNSEDQAIRSLEEPAEAEQLANVETEDTKWPGWPGESVFRVLVSAQKVGALIGRKGEFIKRMCDESKARIKILDGPPGVPERAVMISAKDEPDALIPPAIDGLLRVHNRITDGLDSETDQAQRGAGPAGPTRLLVPASQAGSLIGKQGATIKSIQDASKCALRILENVPPVALNDDRVVEIQGEPHDVHKAVELIANHLRKFLVDRSVLPLFEMQMKVHSAPREQPMPAPQQWGPPPPWSHPPNIPPSGPGYGGNPHFMPPRPQDNYYPPPDVHHVEKQPHYGISSYGRDANPTAAPTSGNQHLSHGSSQISQKMQVPLSYADAVIGSAGANISYIRKHSGATISIQEGVPGEMTVEIAGSASQVQTAQQLIKNFMAEASPQVPPPGPAPPSQPVDSGYNSYPPYGGPSYATPPGGAGPTPHNGGGYGAHYPPNYGY